MLHTASLDQILRIWSRLAAAHHKYGDGPKTNCTQISLYELTPYDPTIHRHVPDASPGSRSFAHAQESRLTAKAAFIAILKLYADHNDVQISVMLTPGTMWRNIDYLQESQAEIPSYTVRVRELC